MHHLMKRPSIHTPAYIFAHAGITCIHKDAAPPHLHRVLTASENLKYAIHNPNPGQNTKYMHESGILAHGPHLFCMEYTGVTEYTRSIAPRLNQTAHCIANWQFHHQRSGGWRTPPIAHYLFAR